MEPLVPAAVFTASIGWVSAVAGLVCMLALLAIALRFGQGMSLQAYLDARGSDEEPGLMKSVPWPAR